jgi:hypothetical protein
MLAACDEVTGSGRNEPTPGTEPRADAAGFIAVSIDSCLQGIDWNPVKPTDDLNGGALGWSEGPLVMASWVSGAILAAYIILFFGAAAISGAAERWNEPLADASSAGIAS